MKRSSFSTGARTGTVYIGWYGMVSFSFVKRAKIERRGMDRWRVTLTLRVIERWKGKREIIVGSSGEKWEVGK